MGISRTFFFLLSFVANPDYPVVINALLKIFCFRVPLFHLYLVPDHDLGISMVVEHLGWILKRLLSTKIKQPTLTFITHIPLVVIES